MKKLLVLIALLALMVYSVPAFAAVALEFNGVYKGEATTINVTNENDGSDETGISGNYGEKTLNIPIGDDLIATGVADGGVSDMVTEITAIPLGYSLVNITITGRTCTLADGEAGQMITLRGHNRLSGTLTINPATETGFTTITMDAEGEIVTLLFVDTTYGWVVVGANGATVNLSTN